MSEYIEVGQPLQFTDPNTPTRVGEIVENVGDIYNIPSPRVGMIVYVESNKKNYIIKSLKSEIINGVLVENARVNTYEELDKEVFNAIANEVLRAKKEEFRIDYKSEDIIESIGARIISKKHIIHREVGKSYTKLVYIGNLPAQQYKSRFFLYDLINDDVTINLCNKNGDVVINLGTIISDTADIEATFNIENSFDAWLSVNLPISQKDYSVDLYCTLIPKNTILDIINDEITRAKNAEFVNSIAIEEEEFRAIKAEKTLQKNIDNTNNIIGIEKKETLIVLIGAVMENGSTYSTNNSAYTNAFEGGDIAVTNEGYFIYDVRKVSADGVAEMVVVKSRRLRTEKGYTYQLNISKDNNAQFSNDELEGIVGLYNYDSSEIEKNKTDIQYLFEEAVKFDSFEVEELGDGIGINFNTFDSNSGSIEIPFSTEEKAGVMSAEDKKTLDAVNSIINIGEYQNIQAVWDACKQVALNNPEISIIKYSVKAGVTYNSGVVFQSYHYNDSIITQYYLYGGGQKHECNIRHIVSDGTTDDWQPIQMFTSYKFENGTLYGYKYGKSESEQNKVAIVNIPNIGAGEYFVPTSGEYNIDGNTYRTIRFGSIPPPGVIVNINTTSYEIITLYVPSAPYSLIVNVNGDEINDLPSTKPGVYYIFTGSKKVIALDTL